MKKLITLLVAVIITASIWAQSPQKMSYQAVIRDASNNLVTSTVVGMKISILKDTPSGAVVYTETRNPTTNANGLISIEIGGGSPSTFAAIDWANGPYFIKTETDPTGGTNYTITGTSQLLSVPYAFYALSAGNATGLGKITEGGHIGWRLMGRPPANFGDIGPGAIDLSFSPNPSTTLGATGVSSVAMGYNTTALGYYATAIGQRTKARAYVSTAIGRYNVDNGNTGAWVNTDPLFTIGNGSSPSNLSNAFLVLKNGTLLAPSFDLAEITSAKALITKEYADANLKPSGLEKITEGGNTGWRLIGRPPTFYGNIGGFATDLSYSNSASTTKGATGLNSTAMGFNSTASGQHSIAIGNKATALGDNSVAIGLGTKVTTHVGIAFGKYNIGGGSTTAWVGTDPYFEIGNGVSNTSRSNVFTIYKNGNTDVNGVIRAQNDIWPTKGAGVEIAYDGSLGKGYIQSYNRDTSTWKDLFLGGLNVAPVNDNFTSLGTSTNKWKAVYAVNGTIQTSDRRLKKEIKNLNYGLNTVMKLCPVSYKWKKGNQDVNLGLIAQDVQKLIPEMVDVGNDKAKTLGLKYTELIPVLIKGMQEQQKEIDALKKMVNKLLKSKIIASN